MRTILLFTSIALLAACAEAPVENTTNELAAAACLPLDAADKAALRKLDQDYAAAWMLEGSEAQGEALLALFGDKAVIIPGGGADPIEGNEALRDFWFPEGSAPTNVTEFSRATSTIEGTTCLAAISGRSEIRFVYEDAQTHQRGNYIILARESAAGQWKIARMIWNNRTIDDSDA